MVFAAGLLVPIIPVGIDFSSELTFPEEETVSTGFLLMSAQALGFFLALIVLQLALISSTLGLGMITLCALIASLITLFINEDLRRIKFIRDFRPEDIVNKDQIITSFKLSS